jgi:hypothetical protein
MIYCVWYPNGGFGHFISAVLSLYGTNFARPKNQLEFSTNGNSHGLDLSAKKYQNDPDNYQFDFDPDINYSVLIDNGINNQGEKFRTVFPSARVIRICYTDHSWPVVAQAMIKKAMVNTIETQLPSWDTANWAVREKYFLFLRDHELRAAWRPTDDFIVHVDDLFDYSQFYNALESCGVELNNFETTWNQWRSANSLYIDPVQTAQGVINNTKQKVNQDLSNITDLWTQAVIYYFIWLEFGIEVPHNDYADWFTNTNDIAIMLDQL